LTWKQLKVAGDAKPPPGRWTAFNDGDDLVWVFAKGGLWFLHLEATGAWWEQYAPPPARRKATVVAPAPDETSWALGGTGEDGQVLPDLYSHKLYRTVPWHQEALGIYGLSGAAAAWDWVNPESPTMYVHGGASTSPASEVGDVYYRSATGNWV